MVKKRIGRYCLLAIFLWSTLLCAASVRLDVKADTLPNGLRILMVPDSNLSVVSCRLYYFVGSMYEGATLSGLSHLYEHMMFKGTKQLGTTNYQKEIPLMRQQDSLDAKVLSLRAQGIADTASIIVTLKDQISKSLDKQRAYIKKDEIWDLYTRNGGSGLNAWTGDDMTAYIVTLPANKIELFYAIESERMRDPILREFTSERDVVLEERRMRIDNRPLSRYWERLNALFYIAHPYRIPTIGWESDVSNTPRTILIDHVKKFYTPDNAVLILSGKFDPVVARKKIQAYFGSIPRAYIPKREVVTREPPPIGVTRFALSDDAEPRLDMLFHTPGWPHTDLFALDILEGILSGRSGRLYTRLVVKDGLCTDASAGNAIRIDDGSFEIWATLKKGIDPAQVEKTILEELKKISLENPSQREMQRTVNEIAMSYVTQLTTSEGISDRLATFERLGSYKSMFTYPDSIAAVNPGSVCRAAKKYLNPHTMTIGVVTEKPIPKEGTKP